jgi:hypothetical protein
MHAGGTCSVKLLNFWIRYVQFYIISNNCMYSTLIHLLPATDCDFFKSVIKISRQENEVKTLEIE